MQGKFRDPLEMAPAIIRTLGSRDAAVAWLTAHTLEQAADDFSVSVAAVKVWEAKLGARCMRKCKRCRAIKAWSAFALDARNHVVCCLVCAAVPKVVLKGREAELAEYRTIPDTIYRWLRTPISSDTGYWPMYATRAAV